MMRRTIILAVTVVIIVVLIGGYVGLTALNGNQPAATPTPSETPQVSSTASPLPELTTQEQARDVAMAYILANHTETAELMTNLSWVGGRTTPEGLMGYETYTYTSTNWIVTVGYPVVQYPLYTVNANYSAGDVTVAWEGTYENGIITATSYNSANLIELSVQVQVRNEVINYIKTSHNETASYLEDLVWAGGRQDTGLLGAEVYIYNTACWTIELRYPVIPNPTYTITANFSAGEMSVAWDGTYENGTIAETSYVSNNLSMVSAQEQIRDVAMNYIKTNHNETAVYMQDLVWTGGRVEPNGMIVGSSTYSYSSIGWNVTMQYPVVMNPIYTITANYVSLISQVYPAQNIVAWAGTWQNGVITETSYSFNP